MASEEDGALLFLIYQHLKVNGFKKAAKGLEKHVTQVETPEEMSNLHDIYTGWMKRCSLAQHAKEEAGDSSPVKKAVKTKPATSEEEGPEPKPFNTTEEEDVDAKPTLDAVESSTVDDSLLGLTPEITTTNEEEKSKEEIQTEQESAQVFAEEPDNMGNSNSSDCVEAVEPPQGESSSVSPDQPDPDPAPDQTQPSDLAKAPSPVSEEPSQDADELQQEPEEASFETHTSEQMPVSQTSATPPCTQEPIETHSSETKESTPKEDPGQAPPTASNTIAAEANEMEALPPTDPDTRSTGKNQLEEVEEEKCEVDGLTSSVNLEVQMEMPSPDPADPSLHVDAPEMEAALKEQTDPDASIILNIEGDISEEVVESCGDQTPKKRKKKKSGRNAETPATDASTSETTSTDTTSDTSTKSPKKKKKKDKNKQQEAEEERKVLEEEEVVEVVQEAPSVKKKAKKRKREKDEKDEEDHVIPVETKSKKKKVRDVQEETAAIKEEEEEEKHPVSPTDTAVKKKKKRRRKRDKGGHGAEEVHSAEQPAEGDTDKEQTLEAADSSGSQLHSAKKKRLRNKPSLRKRLRRQRFERSSSCSTPVGSPSETPTAKKKLKLMETPHQKAAKRPQPESAPGDKTPTKKKMKLKAKQEENSSKENQPPKKKKKGKSLPGEGDRGAVSDPSAADAPPRSEKTKKKKKKKPQKESSTPVTCSQQEPVKKKKEDLQKEDRL